MKFKKNKKGFTLVELVVGTAILSIIGLTTAMLMTSGTNMYRNVHRRSTVLFKSQVAATQLQQAIVDCEYPFAVYNDTLFVGGVEQDEEDSTKMNKIIHVYLYDEADKAIYLRNDKVNNNSGIVSLEAGERIPFCYNVTSIEYVPKFSAEGNVAYALKFKLIIQKFGLDYGRDEILSLRNHPVLVSGNDADDTEQKLAEKLGALS